MRRLFETMDGHIQSDLQIQNAWFVVTGQHIMDAQLDNLLRHKLLLGIEKEVNPADWEAYIKKDRIGAMHMYREYYGSSLKEARDAVYEKEGLKI